MSKKRAPRVIIGLQDQALSEYSSNQSHSRWSEEEECLYLERVRTRAQEKAKQILAQAMAEAEQTKAQAAQQGYEQGMQQAEQQIQAQVEQINQHLGQILNSIQEQKQKIWQYFRSDLIKLIQLSVQKTIAIELDSKREQSLQALLEEAVNILDTRQNICINVHPEDGPILQDMMHNIAEQYPELGNWKIKNNPQLSQGGVVLESCEGMVDNSIDSRFETVQKIISQLGLEEEEK